MHQLKKLFWLWSTAPHQQSKHAATLDSTTTAAIVPLSWKEAETMTVIKILIPTLMDCQRPFQLPLMLSNC